MLRTGKVSVKDFRTIDNSKFKILYSTDDFKRAETKVEQATNDSDIGSEVEVNRRRKRAAVSTASTPLKVIKTRSVVSPIRFQESDDDDEDSTESVSFPAAPKSPIIPIIGSSWHSGAQRWRCGIVCNQCRTAKTVKYIGVNFDSNLKWQSHIRFINAKGRSLLRKLYYIRALCPTKH